MFLDLTKKSIIEISIMSYLSTPENKGHEIANTFDLFDFDKATSICENIIRPDGTSYFEMLEVTNTMEKSDRFGYHKHKLLRYRIAFVPRKAIKFSMTCINPNNEIEIVDSQFSIVRVTAKKVYTSSPSITFVKGKDGYYWCGWKLICTIE